MRAEIFVRDVAELVGHEDDAVVATGNRISMQLVAVALSLGFDPADWQRAVGQVTKKPGAVDRPGLLQDLADTISRGITPAPFEVTITGATPISGSTEFNFLFDIACAACGSFGLELSADTPDEAPIRCPDCGAYLGNMAYIKAECRKAVRERHASHQ